MTPLRRELETYLRKRLEAKRRLEELLEGSEGKFTLKSHGVGKYGRCLGEIFIDEVNINNLLIEEGYARIYK